MFDGNTGQLKSMKNLNSGASIPLHQTFQYYIGHPGNTSVLKFQASGAYVFRPMTSTSYDFQPSLVKKSLYIQVPVDLFFEICIKSTIVGARFVISKLDIHENVLPYHCY